MRPETFSRGPEEDTQSMLIHPMYLTKDTHTFNARTRLYMSARAPPTQNLQVYQDGSDDYAQPRPRIAEALE